MHKKILLLISVFLITGCEMRNNQQEDSGENQPEEQVENQTTESENEEVELTKEEKLMQSLPEQSTSDDWNLLLVGPWDALPENYEPTLVEVDNEQRIDEKIEDAWFAWKDAALQAGHRLFFASGYRSVAHQEANFNTTYENHLSNGHSEEEALNKTKEYLTEPGHSEHHTGLALDIVDEEWIVAGHGLSPNYDTQASQQWLMDTMTDYGFILRYPKGKEEITGIQYESWHFRYVGQENAQFIVEHDLVLEEYIDLLKQREETTME